MSHISNFTVASDNDNICVKKAAPMVGSYVQNEVESILRLLDSLMITKLRLLDLVLIEMAFNKS